MNRERAARAYDLIAEGFAELAIAVREIEPAAARAAVPEAGTAHPAPADPPREAYLMDADETSREQPALKPQVDAGLGKCPTHGTSWTVKAGGISRNGKPYKAFWKCSEKDGDAFCNEKPQKIWADTHPAERAA
jgi:hypothetical protein